MIWDLPAVKPFAQASGPDQAPVRDLRFGPDGLLASGHSDGTVRVWNPGLSGDPEVIGRHDGQIRAVAFPAGELVVSAGPTGRSGCGPRRRSKPGRQENGASLPARHSSASPSSRLRKGTTGERPYPDHSLRGSPASA